MKDKSKISGEQFSISFTRKTSMHLKKETHFLNQGVGDDTMVGVGSAGPGRSRTGLNACTHRPAAAARALLPCLAHRQEARLLLMMSQTDVSGHHVAGRLRTKVMAGRGEMLRFIHGKRPVSPPLILEDGFFKSPDRGEGRGKTKSQHIPSLPE